jgi:hypothetical protein
MPRLTGKRWGFWVRHTLQVLPFVYTSDFTGDDELFCTVVADWMASEPLHSSLNEILPHVL